MSRAIEIVSRSPPARCHGQIRAGHLKHLTSSFRRGGPKPRTQSKVRTDSWRSQRIGQLTTAVFTAAFEPVKKRIEAVQNSAHP